MMKTLDPFEFRLSRRQMLLASGGFLAAVTVPSGNVLAQRTAAESAKELVFRTTDPRNGEPQLEHLVQSWLTPTKHFYVRSHAPNPQINAADYRLQIEGMVRKPTSVSLADLSQLPRQSVTATLTCAGNRRSEFNAEGKVGGVQWEAGAIGNATWDGVALADLLKQAELLESAKHVWFEGLDEIPRGHGTIPFGASIPLEKAMSREPIPGALLVDQMNGAPLTADHGFPLRTVVPGYIGARSVKWLGKIIVSDRPSPNHYQATAYKIVAKPEPLDWSEAGPIYRYPINAAICTPAAGAKVRAGNVDVAGYVLPTGRAAARASSVHVSSDRGATWQPAELVGKSEPFCWQLWRATVAVTESADQLWVKAADQTGGFMPQRVAWNAKGYLQNSWYRSTITVESSDG